ncbi:MAG: hypothetical protein MJ072_05895, partial [Clostridia bacterium]|nr:hypothetical protein [Clostridia bacterium]
LILVVAFIYGAIKLFRKGKPLYFQLFVVATGCRVMERLIVVTTIICGFTESDVSVAMLLGMFSYGLFAFSANYGVLDAIVDDRSDVRNKKARILAFIAPVIVGIMAVIIVMLYVKNYSLYTGVLIAIAVIPCLFGSYYNLKHLILPTDELGLLKATRSVNLIALIAYIVGIANNLVTALFPNSVLISQIHVVVFILPVLIVIYSVKGAEQWKI